ncbi:MAG: hypothetical protein IT443_07605 [Phycisphaeraceae bacterium]|nr:hypothetical protein [Phycisphaeraceae bacterium]
MRFSAFACALLAGIMMTSAAWAGSVPGPLSATLKLNDSKDTQFKISFTSVVGTTWTYKVEELKGRDLSHWLLELGACLDNVVTFKPSSADIGKDGSTGYYGIKWNVSEDFKSAYFSFTLDNAYEPGTLTVLAKASTKYATADIYGPDCNCPVITVPVPSAVWAGLAVLGGLAAVKTMPRLRKRHH